MQNEITQTDSSIIFSAYFLTQSDDIVEKGFLWVSGQSESRVNCGSGYENGEFSATVTYDLTIGNSYSVRAYATTEDKTVYSKTVDFISGSDGVKQSISHFSPLSAQIGDTISIYGRNLSYIQENVKVHFGEALATLAYATDTLLKVLVPSEIADSECHVFVEINRRIVPAISTFILQAPVIDDFEPKLITGLDGQINIYGSGFSENAETFTLQIGGHGATIISTSYDHITARVSDSVVPDLEITYKKLLPVEIVIAGKVIAANDSLLVDYEGAWTRLDDFPGPNRRAAISFTYNGYGYYGLGSNADLSVHYKDLWKFDPENDTWVELAPFPSKPRIYSAVFRVDNCFYLVGGNTGVSNNLIGITDEVWKYKIDENKWVRMADFKYGPTMHAEGFSTNNQGFIYSGYKNDFVMGNDIYSYIPELDDWYFIGEDMAIAEGYPLKDIQPEVINGTDLVYISIRWYPPGLVRNLRSYNPVTNEWFGLGTFYGDAPGFMLNDRLYIGPNYLNRNHNTDYMNQINIMDLTEGRMHTRSFKGEARNEVCNFAIGDFGYFLCGYREEDGELFRDIWKFDSSKPNDSPFLAKR